MHENSSQAVDFRTVRHETYIQNTRELAHRRKRNQRYRSDANFRAQRIAEVESRHRANLSSGNYKELVSLRKRIWSQRERIDRWTIKLEGAERKLLALVKEKEKVARKWKEEKKMQ